MIIARTEVVVLGEHRGDIIFTCHERVVDWGFKCPLDPFYTQCVILGSHP